MEEEIKRHAAISDSKVHLYRGMVIYYDRCGLQATLTLLRYIVPVHLVVSYFLLLYFAFSHS